MHNSPNDYHYKIPKILPKTTFANLSSKLKTPLLSLNKDRAYTSKTKIAPRAKARGAKLSWDYVRNTKVTSLVPKHIEDNTQITDA